MRDNAYLRAQWETNRLNPTVESLTEYALFLRDAECREFPIVYAKLKAMGGDIPMTRDQLEFWHMWTPSLARKIVRRIRREIRRII